MPEKEQFCIVPSVASATDGTIFLKNYFLWGMPRSSQSVNAGTDK